LAVQSIAVPPTRCWRTKIEKHFAGYWSDRQGRAKLDVEKKKKHERNESEQLIAEAASRRGAL